MQVLLMGLGSVGCFGGKAAAQVAAGMEGDPSALVKDLHHPRTEPHLHGLVDQ